MGDAAKGGAGEGCVEGSSEIGNSRMLLQPTSMVKRKSSARDNEIIFLIFLLQRFFDKCNYGILAGSKRLLTYPAANCL